MGLYQHQVIINGRHEIYEEGDWVMTDPDGDPLASWRKQTLTRDLVHRMINEAYEMGERKGGAQLAQIKAILKS